MSPKAETNAVPAAVAGTRAADPRPVVLLGPQRLRPTLLPVVERLGVEGPLAIVTAGWQEREGEDQELRDHLRGRAVNLRLYQRMERVFATDRELAQAHRARQQRLHEMRDLYNVRLAHAMDSLKALLARQGDAQLLAQERAAAMQSLRELDDAYLARVIAVHEEFDATMKPAERDSLARHRRELERELAACAGLAVAGGHVAVLLNRLRLLGVAELLERSEPGAAPRARQRRPVFAWSAGAMVLGERVVLFHDAPPQGPGNAEVFDRGLGWCADVLPLPHAWRRLNLSDPARVARFAQRFAPQKAMALEDGAQLVRRDGCWTAGSGVVLLTTAGDLVPQEGNVSIVTPPSLPKLALDRLRAQRPLDPAAVDEFLHDHSFPLVEGPRCTFVWRGHADAVHLRHWVYGLPSSQPFERLPGTDLWALVLELPDNSRVEYKFEIVRDGRGEWIEDPLNHRRARDPFGANSVVTTTGYVAPTWVLPDPEARQGELDELVVRSRHLGGPQRVQLYLPARLRRTRRYPLLVVHDGGDYLQYADLKVVLDNLIHRLEIPALVAALLHPQQRLTEYAGDDRHADFLSDELVPRLERRLPLLASAEGRGLMGASFGAVASLHAAWRRPGFYGRLLLQSGSFAFTDIGRSNHRGPLFDPVVQFVNAFRSEPGVVAERLFVSCGTYESLIYENRSLVPLLTAAGMDVRFVETRDGHNWENWRDRLREGLSWLFPGPLWMVYE